MTMPSAKPASVGLTDNKKASKPLIEKRRRARINNSLAQLKSIVVGTRTNATTPNGKPPKLEKADILEMTVEYLRKSHQEFAKAPEDDKYIAGFFYCLNEVQRFIENNIDTDAKSRVLSYLNSFSRRILLSSSNRRSPSSDLEAVNMDDSSCSSNSRSETPSSLFMESSPMEYRICSPCPESHHETSTSSISSSSSELRLSLEKCHFANHRKACATSSSSQMPADSTSSSLHNLDRNSAKPFTSRPSPLNLTHGSQRNHPDSFEMNYDHKKFMHPHMHNQLHSNFSNNAIVNQQQVVENFGNQEQLNVADNNQEHTNEFVWRPW